jgi:hypothetical protein
MLLTGKLLLMLKKNKLFAQLKLIDSDELLQLMVRFGLHKIPDGLANYPI